MARRNYQRDITSKNQENDNDNELIFINVVRNFQDSTDNNRLISAGSNSYYKTTKERAAKLVNAGFCAYENTIEDKENHDIDSKEDVNEEINASEDTVSNEDINPENTDSEDTASKEDIDDENTDPEEINDNDDIPNE